MLYPAIMQQIVSSSKKPKIMLSLLNTNKFEIVFLFQLCKGIHEAESFKGWLV